MKLGLRIALSLLLPLIALTAFFGYLYEQKSQALLREELSKEGRAIALVVQTATEDYLRDRQPADLKKLVDQVSGYERVLGMRIFRTNGTVFYQSSSLEQFTFRDTFLIRRVIETGRPVEIHKQLGGQSVLGIMFPLVGKAGKLEGVGQVLQLESFVAADARASRIYIVFLTLAMALATVLVVVVVTRFSIAQPVAELVRSFRRAGGGDLTARAPIRGSDDELTRLAQEFNGMCERLGTAQDSLDLEQRLRHRVESRLRNAQRLAGLGRLAAGLAHEIGTPLNVISGRAEGLRRDVGDGSHAARSLEDISAQSDRIVKIVRDMLDFARMKSPRREPISLSVVAGRALAASRDRLEARGITSRMAIPEEFPEVVADADQLQQVFQNLISNARDATGPGGTITVGAEERVTAHAERGGDPRRFACVTVSDTGSGIRPEDREHVFDPFFTTKEPGQGMGLGLAVAYGIVEEHGGWLEVRDPADTGDYGTTIAVYLPIGTVTNEPAREFEEALE